MRKAVELGEVAFCVGTENRSCVFLVAISGPEERKKVTFHLRASASLRYVSGANERKVMKCDSVRERAGRSQTLWKIA